jgi:hypothetical protein
MKRVGSELTLILRKRREICRQKEARFFSLLFTGESVNFCYVAFLLLGLTTENKAFAAT